MRTGPAIGLIVVAFILVVGVVYLVERGAPSPTATSTAPVATTTPDYYENTASWQAYQDSAEGVSVSYPLDFDATTDGLPGSDPSWRANSGGVNGMTFFTLTVPKAFEPQTNFADAKFTIGKSSDAAAVADCLTSDPSGGPNTATSTVFVNGTNYTVFTSNDAGAGNLYDTTSYRTVLNDACYAVEYTIHSTQLANYPASYGLTQFDEARVKDVLDRIVSTVTIK
jgi:hypothetical protein